MAGVVKNLMVRAGADFSAITQQSKKASSSMRAMSSDVSKSCNAMKSAVSGLKKAFTLGAVVYAARRIYQAGREAAEAYDQQAEAEMKLARVMRNTMHASNSEIQSILDLASAQQKLGVVSDEVQIAGAQELATYLSMSSSLQKLIPVMNDMAVQQYGYNVTAEQTTTIATMLGKVMNGQVGALSRLGYTFDAAQEKLLKYGTEEQRVATLSKVVEQSVGGMNAALAATPTGRMKQLSNTLGDIKEKFGQAVRTIATVFLPLLNKIASILAAVATLANKVAQAIANVFGGKAAGKEWRYLPAGTAGDISDAADAVDSTAESMNDAAKAAKQATKAVEEYRSTVDFDRLHVLSFQKPDEDDSADDITGSNSISPTTGVGSESNAGGSIQEIDTGTEVAGESIGWLESLLQKLKEKWEDFKSGLDLSRLKDAFSNLKDAFKPIVEDLGKALTWLWENALKPLATWSINELAPRLVNALANAFRILHDVFVLLEPVLRAIWPILKWLAELVGFAITTALDQLNQVLKDLHAVLSGEADPLTKLRVTLYGLTAIDLGLLIGSLIELANTAGVVAEAVGTLGTAIGIGTASAGIGSLVGALAAGTAGVGGFSLGLTGTMVPALTAGTAATGAAAAGATGLLGPIAAVIAIIAVLGVTIYECVKHWDEIKEAAGKAWDWTKEKWQKAGEWFKTNVWSPLKTKAKEAFENCKDFGTKAREAISQKWQDTGSWFNTTVWTPLKTKAKESFEGVKDFGSKAREAVSQKWKDASFWFSSTVWTPLRTIAKDAWDNLTSSSKSSGESTKSAWQSTKEQLSQQLQAIKQVGAQTFEAIRSAGTSAGDSIRNAFTQGWSAIQNAWSGAENWFSSSVFSPIINAGKSMVERIVQLFEQCSQKVSGFVSKIKGSFNSLSTSGVLSSFSSLSISLPHLASGAVIPPNREFTAVLGDQTAGTNIETPERLLRKIMRQELTPITGLKSGTSDMLNEAVREGSANGMLLRALDDILEAIMAGHDIVVDDERLGRTVRRMMREQGRISGTARA